MVFYVVINDTGENFISGDEEALISKFPRQTVYRCVNTQDLLDFINEQPQRCKVNEKINRMKKQTNTSVTATFKNGEKKTFETIEEASEVTGLEINSIKARANKPGSGAKSKDGITFEWADPAVRRSKQAKKSKQKGSQYELEIIHKLRDVGYEGCVSSRSQNKLADADKIDIVDMNNELPVNIQAKFTQNMPNYFDIRDACSDKSKPFCICWKKAGKNGAPSVGQVAVIPIEYFYELLKK